MLIIVVLSAVMLCVVMLSVIIHSVVTPIFFKQAPFLNLRLTFGHIQITTTNIRLGNNNLYD
jgi:hypothetical protein